MWFPAKHVRRSTVVAAAELSQVVAGDWIATPIFVGSIDPAGRPSPGSRAAAAPAARASTR